jgi:hypothetical protein
MANLLLNQNICKSTLFTLIWRNARACTFHRVTCIGKQSGTSVSIFMGILWCSDVTAQRHYLYRLNERLARVGLTPAFPGDNPLADSVKALPLMSSAFCNACSPLARAPE